MPFEHNAGLPSSEEFFLIPFIVQTSKASFLKTINNNCLAKRVCDVALFLALFSDVTLTYIPNPSINSRNYKEIHLYKIIFITFY